jgi:hypothetical protein
VDEKYNYNNDLLNAQHPHHTVAHGQLLSEKRNFLSHNENKCKKNINFSLIVMAIDGRSGPARSRCRWCDIKKPALGSLRAGLIVQGITWSMCPQLFSSEGMRLLALRR